MAQRRRRVGRRGRRAGQVSPTPTEMDLQPTRTSGHLLTLVLWSPALGEANTNAVDVNWSRLGAGNVVGPRDGLRGGPAK